MSADNARPIIIKKIKKSGGEGHHGGAWKVAYADFVTAMMAFFLLMWLLNATTESQRKGIADYFNPSIPLSRVSGGGDGSFGGDSVFSEETLAQNGAGGARDKPTEQRAAKGLVGTSADKSEFKSEALEALETELLGRSGDSMISDMARRHVVTRLTDEGLVVEIFDIENEPLFDPATGDPTPTLVELIAMLAEVFLLVENPVAVDAHIRSVPIVERNPMIWDQSTRRAHHARRLLEENGFDPARIARLSGHADRRPVAANPLAIRNNRVEIILLRSDIGG